MVLGTYISIQTDMKVLPCRELSFERKKTPMPSGCSNTDLLLGIPTFLRGRGGGGVVLISGARAGGLNSTDALRGALHVASPGMYLGTYLPT